MKKYIIITYDIHPIGGTQAYTAGKAKYLESCDWNVDVLFSGLDTGRCDIEYLNKFIYGGYNELRFLPYTLHEHTRNFILDEMLARLSPYDGEDTIVIESHFDVAAFWGELLAEKLCCKHYFFCCNEYYRNTNGQKTYYKENLDFFYFKYRRKELIGANASIKKLFNGYKEVTAPLIEYPELIVEQDPVQDVCFKGIDLLPPCVWNICIVSRLEKPYVKQAIKGVKNFAKRHTSSRINLIFIGDEKSMYEKIYQMFSDIVNVNIVFWGVLVPLPRVVFEKINVVIAVAQTARFISYENVYVITANVLTKMPSGLLGYDTQDSWYGSSVEGKNYEDFLEDVLVLNKYGDKIFNMPKHKFADCYYEKQWEYLNQSSSKREYCTQRLKAYRSRDWIALFPYWQVGENENVIIYGAGRVGSDYILQIEESRYCNLVAVVDNKYEEYDSTVCAPEYGLKNNDFDVVVIAARSMDWADQMIEDVKKLTSGKKIVYDIKLCWT